MLETFKLNELYDRCIFVEGTHWIFEIVSLIVHGADASKIERSHMATGPELSMALPTDLEAIEKATPGYKLIDDWKSPRVFGTHLIRKLFPPDGLRKKVKVTISLGGGLHGPFP